MLDLTTEHLDIISSTYDSAIDPENWPDYLDRIAHAIGAKGATFFVLDRVNEHLSVSFFNSVWTEEVAREYFEQIAPLESDAFEALAKRPRTEFVTDVDFYGSAEVKTILAKTGAARQIDLIRLASLITPPVNPANDRFPSAPIAC